MLTLRNKAGFIDGIRASFGGEGELLAGLRGGPGGALVLGGLGRVFLVLRVPCFLYRGCRYKTPSLRSILVRISGAVTSFYEYILGKGGNGLANNL